MTTQTSRASFSLSPQSLSFTSCSSENIADIAARVVKELNLSRNDPYDDDFYGDGFDGIPQSSLQDDTVPIIHSDDEESEFEFAVLTGSPISADEIFDNGQIKPIFPIFNTDLLFGKYHHNPVLSVEPQPFGLPLRKLLEERRSGSGNGTVSSSSSEADDLEGVPPGTYCVWTPKKKEEVMMKKKSKSTGSESKRWRFRDLLHRSNSDGKESFLFFTPTTHEKVIGNGGGKGGDGRRREKKVVVDGRRKSAVDAGKNKKSYLPYRQDLVGLFANVNGISRTVRPF